MSFKKRWGDYFFLIKLKNLKVSSPSDKNKSCDFQLDARMTLFPHLSLKSATIYPKTVLILKCLRMNFFLSLGFSKEDVNNLSLEKIETVYMLKIS